MTRTKEQQRVYYSANREKIKATSAKWATRNSERRHEIMAKWRKENPKRNHELQMQWRNANKEKRRAHRMVEHRLKTGAMVKQPCENCGSLIVHAHHEDYGKPLEVKWLCPKHHNDRHTELRNA